MEENDKQPIEQGKDKAANKNQAENNDAPNDGAVVATTEKPKKSVWRKVLSIAGTVLFVLVILVALFVVFITVASKKDKEGVATVFGYQLRFVLSGSMEKCSETDVSGYKIKSIPTKSCVFVKTAPSPSEQKALKAWCDELKVGDVLTFNYNEGGQKVITHRIVSITPTEDGKGYVIILQGDNTSDKDNVGQQKIDTTELGVNYIIGKVEGQSVVLGFLVYAFKSPLGLIFLIIVPCLIIIAYEVVKIVGVVGADKKMRRAKEKEDRDNEIALLKKQLELLQKSAAQGALTETANGENTATSAKDENMQSENGQNGSVDEKGN